MIPPTIPSEFEVKILKWIFLPLFVAGVVFTFGNNYLNKRKCKIECKEKGYAECVYIPSFRFSQSECICREPNSPKMKAEMEIYIN